jgi:protein phosphatase
VRARLTSCACRLRQGGIGPAGLATDDLYVLDLANAPRWHRVVRLGPTAPLASLRRSLGCSTLRSLRRAVCAMQVVQGEGPGARYAHVLALVGQRFLLVLGGNDGYKARTMRCAVR